MVKIEDWQIRSIICIIETTKEEKQYFLKIREYINRHILRTHHLTGKFDSKWLILKIPANSKNVHSIILSNDKMSTNRINKYTLVYSDEYTIVNNEETTATSIDIDKF